MGRKKKVIPVVDVPAALPDSPTINHKERTHYINGGSSINRRIKCPGSAHMEAQFESTDTEYSTEGTFIHEGIDAAIPQCFKAGKVEFTLSPLYSPTQIKSVEAAIDNIWEIVGHIYDSIGWVAEKKFVLNHELELGGSADFAYAYNDTEGNKIGGIWDYKNGVMQTDIIQCVLYMVAMNETVKGGFDIMRGHIFQPNSLQEDKVVKFIELTREEIAEYRALFIETANVSMGRRGQDALQLIPGVEQCQFCRASHKCPAVREQNKALMDEIIVANSTDFLPDPLSLPTILTDEQVLKWLKNSAFIKLVDKAMWRYASTRFEQGLTLPGTKAVTGRSSRSWSDTKSVESIEKMLATMGVADSTYKCLHGIGDIENALHKAGAGTRKNIKIILEPLVKRSTPGVSIVLDDETTEHLEEVKASPDSLIELIIIESAEE